MIVHGALTAGKKSFHENEKRSSGPTAIIRAQTAILRTIDQHFAHFSGICQTPLEKIYDSVLVESVQARNRFNLSE
jgi:hypothetical protein